MKCKYIKQDDEQCGANSMVDNDFCFTHNPDMEESKAIAVKKGGEATRKNYEPLPPILIENTKNITTLLSSTINEVRAGTIELRVANSIGYLAGHLIKAFEASIIEDRLIEVEKVILERKKYK
jgi:hypothetical protein